MRTINSPLAGSPAFTSPVRDPAQIDSYQPKPISDPGSTDTFTAAKPDVTIDSYYPTQADLNRPTTAFTENYLTGDKTPLNPAQMSTQQGVSFVQQQLQNLGYSGPGVVSNQTAPTVGPYGIDYNGDDRRHWDIDGMNVGLTEQLYASYPKDVADRMLADMIKVHQSAPSSGGDSDGQVATFGSINGPGSGAQTIRATPGVDLSVAFRSIKTTPDDGT